MFLTYTTTSGTSVALDPAKVFLVANDGGLAAVYYAGLRDTFTAVRLTTAYAAVVAALGAVTPYTPLLRAGTGQPLAVNPLQVLQLEGVSLTATAVYFLPGVSPVLVQGDLATVAAALTPATPPPSSDVLWQWNGTDTSQFLPGPTWSTGTNPTLLAGADPTAPLGGFLDIKLDNGPANTYGIWFTSQLFDLQPLKVEAELQVDQPALGVDLYAGLVFGASAGLGATGYVHRAGFNAAAAPTIGMKRYDGGFVHWIGALDRQVAVSSALGTQHLTLTYGPAASPADVPPAMAGVIATGFGDDGGAYGYSNASLPPFPAAWNGLTQVRLGVELFSSTGAPVSMRVRFANIVVKKG